MNSKNPIFLCFPGFLGLPSDFQFLEAIGHPVKIVDICGNNAPKIGQSWTEWESQVLPEFEKEFKGQKVVVVGYSMGARIVLQLLSKNPHWISAAILISCHPGLSTESEKVERATNDSSWALRFKNEDWTTLIDSWNKQVSLLNSFAPLRIESKFNRNILARVLETFSLSKQDSIVDSSILLPSLICWGQKDNKFEGLAARLKQAFCVGPATCIPESGHRVIFDNPSYLTEIIKEFITANSI